MSSPALYEIRQYHFDAALLEEYKEWVRKEAHPLLAQKLDIVGFWTSTGKDSQSPLVALGTPDPLGSANVIWIIRFRDRAHCDEAWEQIKATDEWKDAFSRVPGGPASYARIESVFAESLF